MPRGSKDAYTDKQKRQAQHIEAGYEDCGLSRSESERRAWATVNKESGGGKKSGSGRIYSDSHDARSEAAKKGWATRRKHKS